MCGIAGFWLKAPERSSTAHLGSMLRELRHRGPDDHGIWIDPHAGLWLGHHRLSIVDLSPSGHQPMMSVGERQVVVFNGEIYNFRELRQELESDGYAFASGSDTEVLLHGYARWGENVLDHLVGMFAFAIWDRENRRLFLARDRAGEKPLHYSDSLWGFAFASEISAVSTLPGVDTTVDPDAVAMYLQYQYVPAPRSIFRGIRKLQPAHAMRVTEAGVDLWRYWDPVPFATGPRLRIDEKAATDELESLLRRAVRGQMIADVPIGAFLSGGVDSSTLVSLMVEESSNPVRTFTIGFDVPRFDESAHAAAVARHLGTHHTVEHLTEADALALIAQVPEMYGEPFSDSSALPTHLVARVARKHVTVCLSGDGGDEAFGGYQRYDELQSIVRASRLTWPLTDVARSWLSRLPGRAGRGGQLLGAPPKEVYRSRVGVFKSADVQRMAGAIPYFAEYERAWSAASALPLRQRAMLADLLTYLPEAILVKVDRAAMRTSLETRAPLLDHRVLEFAAQLPFEFVLRKRLLKKLAFRRIPKPLIERPKQGFGVPLGKWFRSELRELLWDALTPARMAAVGIDDYGVVRRTLASHMSGEFDEHPRLWALLVLSLWHEGQNSRVGKSFQLASVV